MKQKNIYYFTADRNYIFPHFINPNKNKKQEFEIINKKLDFE